MQTDDGLLENLSPFQKEGLENPELEPEVRLEKL